MSLRDISYLRYHFIHAAEPAESETVWACAEIVRVFPHSDNFEDLRGNEFPLRLHFSVRARECYTKYFAEKQEFRGDPIFSNGFAWYIAVRLTAGGLQFGFRALPFPYTAQSTFKRVHCSGIVKAGEFINLAVEEDVNFVGGNEFHPYQITDSSEFLTDGGTGIVSTVITITDATLQAERQSMPTRPQSNKKKDQDDMKEIMDRVIRPRMRDDGTVEFGSYVHFENPLGQGGFGAVYAGYRKTDELPVAVKLMQYTGHTDLAAAEITILTDLTGVTPHLVSVFDIYLAPSQVYLVMELCNIGDLHYYIRCTTDKKLPEDTIRHFLKHMIEAMRVLRAKNIVHRDLKPQNLLLHDYNKTAHPSAHDLTLKVADFGLARYLADDSLAKSILGTRHYMAPEVAKAYWEGRPANYTPSVDLWAIGIILVECFTGNRPSLTGGEAVLELPHNTSTPLNKLIKGLLRTNPHKRMTFPDFFENEFCKIVDGPHVIEPLAALPDDETLSKPSELQPYVNITPVPPVPPPKPAHFLRTPSTTPSDESASGWTDTLVKEKLKGTPKVLAPPASSSRPIPPTKPALFLRTPTTTSSDGSNFGLTDTLVKGPNVRVPPACLAPPIPPPKPSSPTHHLRTPATTSSGDSGSGWTDTLVKELSKVWTPKAVVAIVVKDYRRMDPGEINLNVGDLVTDIEQVNNGWWRGVCNGKFGTFPAKHVELRGRQN